MADKYLISSTYDGIETFYTADSSGVISSIGTRLDWNYGFDADVLSYIDNATYSSLPNVKVWVNRTDIGYATEETTGEGIIKSTDATAIDCSGYSSITSMKGTSSNNDACKIILTFDKGGKYYTRGNGSIASSSVAIPYVNPDDVDAIANRNNNVVDIADDFNTLFDGDNSSMYQYGYENGATGAYTPLQIGATFITPIVARRYDINVLDTCRFPVLISLQRGDYDPDTNTTNWVEIDHTTIRSPKLVSRYFRNSVASSNYRWVINADPTDLADDPERYFEATELNIYGQTTGITWLECKENEIKSKGITFTELNKLTSNDFKEIFSQTQINYVVYIPSGATINNITANFPANGAPEIEYFTVKNKIHADDVTAYFEFNDPEGDPCNYEIYVNGVLAAAGINVDPGVRIGPILLKNHLFNRIDDKDTRDVIEATNTVTLKVIDQYNAAGTKNAIVTKTDYFPEYIGTLIDNVYTLSITDRDPDECKYTAYINGKQIHSIGFTRVPIVDSIFSIDTDDLLIGKQNELKIVIEDAVGGIVNVVTKFIGEYNSLLFFDKDDKVLSTDKGKILKEIDFGTMLLGKTSDPILVKVVNKTAKNFKNLIIKSPEDIDAEEVRQFDAAGNYIGSTRIPGSVMVQLSFNESFSDLSSLYNLTIPNLAVNQQETFYVRVAATNPGAKPDMYRFDITGTADNT